MEELKRDSFVFYRSFREALEDLSDNDQLVMYRAICDYSLDGREPELRGFPKAMFKLIQPLINANTKRWLNAKKGGAPKGNSNARKQPKNNLDSTKKQPKNNLESTENQSNVYVNANVDANANVNVPSKEGLNNNAKAKRFAQPTLEELEAYIKEKSYKVDGQKFLDYYESNGWKVGKNPMKDWRAAVRTWNRSSYDNRTVKNPIDIGRVLSNSSSDKYSTKDLW